MKTNVPNESWPNIGRFVSGLLNSSFPYEKVFKVCAEGPLRKCALKALRAFKSFGLWVWFMEFSKKVVICMAKA